MAVSTESGRHRALKDERYRELEDRVKFLENAYAAELNIRKKVLGIIETQQAAVLGAHIIRWLAVIGAAAATIIVAAKGWGK